MDDHYRGDERGEATLKDEGGFKAWYPIDLETARDLVRFVVTAIPWDACCFKPIAIQRRYQFPTAALSPTGAKALTGLPKCPPSDFMRWIIACKDRGPTISTAPDKGCGGYTSGTIYKIDCSALTVFEFKDVKGAMDVPSRPTPPGLVMDNSDLNSANVIAIKDRSAFGVKELTFLTPIPMSLIEAS